MSNICELCDSFTPVRAGGRCAHRRDGKNIFSDSTCETWGEDSSGVTRPMFSLKIKSEPLPTLTVTPSNAPIWGGEGTV